MNSLKKKAIQLIIFFGFISLLGDIVYEGARSVNGPYLKMLGVNAALLGLIAGSGEFLGYTVRLVSGYFSDKTKAYWGFTILGYGMLISVPFLAMTGFWQLAAALMITERVGKALRSPAKDTIISHAAKQVGTGFGFALLEAMDQIGAMTGPLIFTVIFLFMGSGDRVLADYQKGYSFLIWPFLLLMGCVFFAFRSIPNPEQLEEVTATKKQSDKLSPVFWIYTGFTFMTTMGYVSFVIMAYHLKTHHIVSDALIPVFYTLAMGIDALVALLFGITYDKLKTKHRNDHAGLVTLIWIPILTIGIPLLGFSNHGKMVLIGVLLWGAVMGIHETIMRSAIADLTPLRKRGTGYGIFNAAYGVAILVGTTAAGFLYDFSVPYLIGFVVLCQVLAMILFFGLNKVVITS